MTRVRDLYALQDQFRSWLTNGDEALVAQMDRAAGMSVYQNNYRSALMGSLEASFPRLHLWLGDEGFQAVAAEFVDAFPPTSWTLDAYGVGFAGYLRGAYRDDPELADLAAIDWAVGDSFVAQDAVPVLADMIGSIDWDRACVTLVPSLRLVQLTTDADTLWSNLVSGVDPDSPATLTAPQTILVWRQGFESVMRRSERHELPMVLWAQDHVPFAEMCVRLAGELGDDAAVAAAGAVLGRWMTEELVAKIG